MREKQVDNAVLDLLKNRGAWGYKNYSAQHNPSGVPDIIACYRGFPLFIENKQPGKGRSTVSFLQKKHLAHITEQGGVGVIAKSAFFIEQVLNAIESDNATEQLKALGWQSHGDNEVKDSNWNEETIW